tara:strand:- start:15745 stop:17322 length:1578 start_codon:yes stop_codon:yes gene_type:complete
MNSNMTRTKALIEQMALQGVKEWVVCPGSRNATFIKSLARCQSLDIHYHFEERSAGYFAIGRILQSDRPVAVVTTSGTAVANLFPAVIEAHHQELPLVVVSADRPESYRGSGAPQSMNQIQIFGEYAGETIEWGEAVQDLKLNLRHPNHVNVCFAEPLVDGEPEVSQIGPVKDFHLSQQVDDSARAEKDLGHLGSKPLIILSAVLPKYREALMELLRETQLPIYIECGSQLKPLEAEWGHALQSGEFALRHLYEVGFFDSIVRIGGVPTVRFWRDLEDLQLPVVHFSSTQFKGLSYETALYSLPTIFEAGPTYALKTWKHPDAELIKKQDCALYELKQKAINDKPNSELALLQNWLRLLSGSKNQVYVGNSLPIRELDLLDWNRVSVDTSIFTQRGMNGIDGSVSLGAGLAVPSKNTWCVLGDLTTLYDLSGFWSIKQRPELPLNYVVINNGGGKIFSRIYDDPNFENRHGLMFESLAQMWGLTYCLVRSLEDFKNLSGTQNLIEICPDNRQSKELWQTLKVIAK